jgi:hypothetical protein
LIRQHKRAIAASRLEVRPFHLKVQDRFSLQRAVKKVFKLRVQIGDNLGNRPAKMRRKGYAVHYRQPPVEAHIAKIPVE